MSNLQQYQELAQRNVAAYAAYKDIYASMNPPPQKPVYQRDNWFILVALAVMMIASVVVSGSRTIPEFGGGVVGVAAFVMVEGGLIGLPFFRTRTSRSEAKIEHVRRLAMFGIGLVLSVGLLANVHNELKASGIFMAEWIETVIDVMVGLSAPALAFICGDILAIETLRTASGRRKLDADHKLAMDTWLIGLNDAWSKEKGKWGVQIRVDRENVRIESASLPAGPSADSPPDIRTDGRADFHHATGRGYSKRTDARAVVWQFLDDHPEAAYAKSRELAAKLEVGKTTVNDVQKEWIAARSSGSSPDEDTQEAVPTDAVV
jgi:hypothetical protein